MGTAVAPPTPPDGTSSRRNLGQLALIFRDQCVTRLLSIWGLRRGARAERAAGDASLITALFTSPLVREGERADVHHLEETGESIAERR